MNTTIEVIEGQYFQDLLAQSSALEATLSWLRGEKRWVDARRFVGARDWKRIVLTGMGSSYHTLHPLNLSLIEAGLNPVMMETSELIHYGLPLCDENTLIVAVSQSGRSAETLRLLDLNKCATVLGVTNTQDSPLATRSHFAIHIQAGQEFSVSCKTYVAGMMALQWLAAVFLGRTEEETLQQFESGAQLVEQYFQSWKQHTESLAGKLRGIHHLFFTGRGGSLAAVGTGALIVKESDRFHAEGMSSAAFRHGPMEMLQDDMFTVVFSGDERTRELNRRLANDLRERGSHCEEIGNDSHFAPFRLPKAEALLRPVLEILPVEMITLALAGIAEREAGYFEHARKITDTE